MGGSTGLASRRTRLLSQSPGEGKGDWALLGSRACRLQARQFQGGSGMVPPRGAGTGVGVAVRGGEVAARHTAGGH